MSYGFCPICGAPGVSRERRPNGNDTCQNGHVYPSREAEAVGMSGWVPEVSAPGVPEHLKGLKAKVDKLSEEQAKMLLAEAMFHLRCVSGSRNSFSSKTLDVWHRKGLGFPERDPQVEKLHMNAVEFIQKHDK